MRCDQKCDAKRMPSGSHVNLHVLYCSQKYLPAVLKEMFRFARGWCMRRRYIHETKRNRRWESTTTRGPMLTGHMKAKIVSTPIVFVDFSSARALDFRCLRSYGERCLRLRTLFRYNPSIVVYFFIS